LRQADHRPLRRRLAVLGRRREIEVRVGIADLLASCLVAARDPDKLTHWLSDMTWARLFAIARGYEVGGDLDC
jgi:hypothetical protein